MRRKIVMIVAALLCGVAGTALLVNFVRGAESRALEGEQLVTVWVASERIPSGTAVETIVASELAEQTQVPVKVRPADAITSLAQIDGKVAATDLLPGEQILAGRFIEPQDFDLRPSTIDVPEGMVEITIPTSPDRVLGGLVAPGERLMIIATFPAENVNNDDSVFEGESVELPESVIESTESEAIPATTHVLMHKVLLTEVQFDTFPAAAPQATVQTQAQPQGRFTTGGSMVLTVALTPGEAERLVFAQEFASLWFASEGPDVPETGTRFQTRATVFEDTRPSGAQ